MSGKTALPSMSLAACLLLFQTQLNAALTVTKNEQTGLLAWTSESNGFSVELIQLLPDFVRAIYSNHNFPPDEVERIAGYCVFGSIIKNTSQSQLSYRVADWTYTEKNGTEHPVKTKSQWLDEWRKVGVTFSWTLLPDSGDFEIGDWQQGFTTIKLPRNAVFDLTYTWTLDGKHYSDVIKNMSCPPESLPDNLLNQ
jgi:hypothetical protein